jgi:hypothetical protein
MNTVKKRAATAFLILALAFLILSPQVLTQTKSLTQVLPPIASLSDSDKVEFAIIGDYGADAEGYGDSEKSVAKMVENWDPAFIISLGDNNYKNGEAETIVENIGKYYCDYIYNKGASTKDRCDGWADEHKTNLFFPSLGNHDWIAKNAQPYLDYFTKLPGNRRYYDFVRGPVHFFVIDSESKQACEEYWCEEGTSCKECDQQPPVYYEPDGTSPDSKQGQWLRDKLKESTSPWKLVYFHHAPYSCKGGSAWMQWPFKEWGANAVLAGHKHIYERGWLNDQQDFPYFVNGTGGTKLSKCKPDDCSSKFVEVIIQQLWGAMWAKATTTEISFKYYDAETGSKLDDCTLTKTGSGQKLNCQATGRGNPMYCPPGNPKKRTTRR